MDRKNVYFTRKIPSIAKKLLEEYFYVEENQEDRPLTKDELLDKITDKNALITQLTDVIDKEVLDGADSLRVIANYAVGYNNIDVEEATRKKIIVTNTPDVLTDTTAELAWALMFSVSRRIVESDRFAREGKFKGWTPTLFLGQDITGKTLGIIGSGRIGRAFAEKSKGFNMNVLYYSRTMNSDFEKETNGKLVNLDTLLRESDFISIHVPLTKETEGLIGEEEFKKMKNSAILINTSRGPIVDEKALVKALKEGEIWGAGLDVYEKEPEIEEELKHLDNVVILPHIGSATTETRDRMAEMAARNVIAVLNGDEPLNPVTKSK